jgi:predicted TIM-barrel fold metal-dependent hydrolase
VEDALARSAELMDFWNGELRRMLPEGAEIFDAHVHLGHDIDGMVGIYEELEGRLDDYGVSRCFMFCMDEHDRHPAFRVPNDRTLAFAERSGGRMIPFVRLDLTEDPIEEAVRCLDRGAKGIKLHPRAQRFALNDERLAPVFELAGDRKVPILIHGGRGLPPIADDLARLVERHPEVQLVIAHAGIADLAGLGSHFGGHAGVFFDTSVWSALDLLDFYSQISPEQVLYASDYPYGRQPNALVLALLSARAAGYDEEQLRGLLGGNARRIVAGERPLPTTPATGPKTVTRPLTLARIHGYLAMASSVLWARQPDAIGAIGLALNTCDEAGPAAEAHARIRELLLPAQAIWLELPGIEDHAARIAAGRLAFQLIHLADITALTTPL